MGNENGKCFRLIVDNADIIVLFFFTPMCFFSLFPARS